MDRHLRRWIHEQRQRASSILRSVVCRYGFGVTAEVDYTWRKNSATAHVGNWTDGIAHTASIKRSRRQISWKRRRHGAGSAGLWHILGQFAELRSRHGGQMIEGGIDQGCSCPEQHARTIRCSALADVFPLHSRTPIESECSVSSGRILKANRPDIQLVVRLRVVCGNKFRETEFVQYGGVGLIGCFGCSASLRSGDLMPSGKIRGKDRRFCRRDRSLQRIDIG